MGGTQEECGWLGVATYVVGGVVCICAYVGMEVEDVVAVRGLRVARGACARTQKGSLPRPQRVSLRRILEAQTHQPTKPKSMVGDERTHSNHPKKALLARIGRAENRRGRVEWPGCYDSHRVQA